MVVAQLVERLLLIPEIRIQIPTSAKFNLPIEHLSRKDENKEEEAGNGPYLKKLKRLTSNTLFNALHE